MSDQWNPGQYNRFKDQRAKPFFDLAEMVRPGQNQTVVDLGCGTGELTQFLHEKLKAKRTLGIDSSEKMLRESTRFKGSGLEFQNGDIGTFLPPEKFDVVFSNAALQWVPNHLELMPKLFSWLKPGGQIAVQMPFNHDHPSHRLAREIAIRKFPKLFNEANTKTNLLPMEKYSELLFSHGFSEQSCLIKIYDHPMGSGRDVVEWTKGTTLTAYQKKLSDSDFADLLDEYTEKLLEEIGTGPYFYAFKRLLFWGFRP